MYSETVMDHFKNPRNVGEIENPDGVGEVGNPVCGDIMKIFLKIENNVVIDAKFKTFGCGAAIASSSMATELVRGKSLEDAWELSNKAVAEALDGLPPYQDALLGSGRRRNSQGNQRLPCEEGTRTMDREKFPFS